MDTPAVTDGLMNLIFLHPALLVFTPMVAIGGWFLLRKAGTPEHIFTILEFWPEQTTRGKGVIRHRPDWPWVLILIAAVLSAMALSSPQWHERLAPATLRPAMAISAIGRLLPGSSNVLDVFIKAKPPDVKTGSTLLVTANHQHIRRTVAPKMLVRGIDIAPVPAAQMVTVTLIQSGHVLARTSLSRSTGSRQVAAHFIGTPPRAFLRLLSAIPNINLHAEISAPGIWIIHNRHFSPASLHGIANSAIILLGDTPGPDLTPGGQITFSRPQSPMIVSREAVLRSVNPSTVQVYKLIKARLGGSWHSLMAVNGHPWLAERDDPLTHVTWLWLAGQVNSAWTDLPHHASFVIFFANVISDIKTLSGAAQQGTWWKPAPSSGVDQSVSAQHSPAAGRTLNLNILLAALVCACLITAVFGLAIRGNE